MLHWSGLFFRYSTLTLRSFTEIQQAFNKEFASCWFGLLLLKNVLLTMWVGGTVGPWAAEFIYSVPVFWSSGSVKKSSTALCRFRSSGSHTCRNTSSLWATKAKILLPLHRWKLRLWSICSLSRRLITGLSGFWSWPGLDPVFSSGWCTGLISDS